MTWSSLLMVISAKIGAKAYMMRKETSPVMVMRKRPDLNSRLPTAYSSMALYFDTNFDTASGTPAVATVKNIV